MKQILSLILFITLGFTAYAQLTEKVIHQTIPYDETANVRIEIPHGDVILKTASGTRLQVATTVKSDGLNIQTLDALAKLETFNLVLIPDLETGEYILTNEFLENISFKNGKELDVEMEYVIFVPETTRIVKDEITSSNF